MQEQTFIQKVVGISFNPSGDENVNKAKHLSADLIELIEQKMILLESNTKEGQRLSWAINVFRTAAFDAVIASQLAVVKFLTWKE